MSKDVQFKCQVCGANLVGTLRTITVNSPVDIEERKEELFPDNDTVDFSDFLIVEEYYQKLTLSCKCGKPTITKEVKDILIEVTETPDDLDIDECVILE